MNEFEVNRRTKFWLLLIVLSATLPSYWAYQNLATAEPRLLKVVMDDNFTPYVFRDAEGTLGGILIDH